MILDARFLVFSVLLALSIPARAGDPVSIGPLGGTASSVLVDPADGDHLLVTKPGGLFRSTDGGTSFGEVVSDLPSSLFGLTADPKDADRIYVTDGTEVYSSADFGASWAPLGFPSSGVRSISASPSANRLLVSTSSDVWLSPDGGATFTSVATGSIIDPVTFAPSDGQIAYYGSINGLFRSSDGGQTFGPTAFTSWTQALIVSPSNDDRVLMGTNSGAFRTTDGGATFNAMTNGLPGNGNAEFFRYEPAGGAVWYAQLAAIFVSTDDGSSWQPALQGLPAQPPIPTDLAFATGGDAFLTADASGGGLYQAPGGSLPWKHIGFAEQQIVDVAVTSTGVRIAASFNGVYAGPPGATLQPTALQFDFGADTEVVVVDPLEPSRWLSGGVGAFIDDAEVRVLTEFGNNFIKTYDQAGAGRVVALEHDPNAPSTVLGGIFPGSFGNAAIIRSTNSGANWTPIGGTAGWATRAIAFDPQTPGRVLQLSDNGQWAESLDGGASWGALQPAWPTAGPSVLLGFDPFTPNLLYRGDQGSGLQRSTDGGSTWTPLGVAVNADSEILFSTSVGGRFWISDEAGNVLVTDDGGSSFQPVFTAPTGDASGLALDTADDTLVIGTIQASAWELPGAGFCPPTFYCTAKTSSAGCVASISTSDPSAQPVSGAGDYAVLASQVQELKNGLLFAGVSGPANLAFSGGVLCVNPALKRGPVMSSAGSNPTGCAGSYSTVVNDAVIPVGLDAGPGNSGWYQYWYRDPNNGVGTLGTALSNAVQLDFQ